MSDLYASPDALRSPLTTTRRFNQQDNTPVSNVSRIFTRNTFEISEIFILEIQKRQTIEFAKEENV